MRPGPKPDPRLRLADAAILYAIEVEAEAGARIGMAWDRLRKAALHYRDTPRARGRIATRRAGEGA